MGYGLLLFLTGTGWLFFMTTVAIANHGEPRMPE
jgi:hypothetical protein